ncbi:MAG: PHP domain-containing protein, partial [Duodenibacillus sp.]|nr:PHP domain-containing protein [Duodenibacillus sp.]
MKVDLHMHSTASDGALAPAELMRFCKEAQGLEAVALTDHDTAAGNAEAAAAAQALGLRFVSGIEISAMWAGQCLHIVGLGIDAACPALAGISGQLLAFRDRRTTLVGDRLAELGWPGMEQAARELAPSKDNVSRTHFAMALVAAGACKDADDAFARFLGAGKPAYIPVAVLTMRDAVERIAAAGGVPVLAHPGRYRLAHEWQADVMVADFADCGGRAIEVVSGSQPAGYTERCVG